MNIDINSTYSNESEELYGSLFDYINDAEKKLKGLTSTEVTELNQFLKKEYSDVCCSDDVLINNMINILFCIIKSDINSFNLHKFYKAQREIYEKEHVSRHEKIYMKKFNYDNNDMPELIYHIHTTFISLWKNHICQSIIAWNSGDIPDPFWAD
jgi:hypothetical protein